VAVDLQNPEGKGGEPVVVVAVQQNRIGILDAALAEQLGELLARGDVARQGIVELRRPVPGDGAGDVAFSVSVGVDIDFD